MHTQMQPIFYWSLTRFSLCFFWRTIFPSSGPTGWAASETPRQRGSRLALQQWPEHAPCERVCACVPQPARRWWPASTSPHRPHCMRGPRQTRILHQHDTRRSESVEAEPPLASAPFQTPWKRTAEAKGRGKAHGGEKVNAPVIWLWLSYFWLVRENAFVAETKHNVVDVCGRRGGEAYESETERQRHAASDHPPVRETRRYHDPEQKNLPHASLTRLKYET